MVYLNDNVHSLNQLVGKNVERLQRKNEFQAQLVTPTVNRGTNGLRYAIENGDIRWHQAEILDKRQITIESNQTDGNITHYDNEHRMELSLSSGEKIQTDKILLATGFGKKPPGGKILDDLKNSGLEVSAFCGFPIVDQHLKWHPRIQVSGEIGVGTVGKEYSRCQISC